MDKCETCDGKGYGWHYPCPDTMHHGRGECLTCPDCDGTGSRELTHEEMFEQLYPEAFADG